VTNPNTIQAILAEAQEIIRAVDWRDAETDEFLRPRRSCSAAVAKENASFNTWTEDMVAVFGYVVVHLYAQELEAHLTRVRAIVDDARRERAKRDLADPSWRENSDAFMG
jgi:hypothetical protein